MIFATELVSKNSEIRHDVYSVEQVVELTERQWSAFERSPLSDWEFLRKYDTMVRQHDVTGLVHPCILVLIEGQDEGRCIYSTCCSCCGEWVHLSNARQFVEKKMDEQYYIRVLAWR